LRAGQADEQAMEVGAVAILTVACPNRISLAPAGAFFAVTHVAFDDFIKNVGRLPFDPWAVPCL